VAHTYCSNINETGDKNATSRDLVFMICWKDFDFCSKRNGKAYLVFLVLSSIREAWDDGRNSRGRGYLTCIDHDKQFHQVIIHFSASALNDVDILSTNTFSDLHATRTHTKDKMSNQAELNE